MMSLSKPFALPYLTLVSTLRKEGRKEGKIPEETSGSGCSN
jgi:hypothetical protein